MRKLTGSARYIFLVIVACSLVSAVEIILLNQDNREKQQSFVRDIATDLSHNIEQKTRQAISATYTIATMVRDSQGQVGAFDTFAKDILHFYPGISALQLAPQGRITYSYPLAGNEKIIGYDLLSADNPDDSARQAVQAGQLRVSEPVDLIQGGRGVIARLPIYLQSNAEQHFWGFGSVLIRTDNLISDRDLERLSALGLEFRLSSTGPGQGVLVESSRFLIDNAVSAPIQFENSHWQLSIRPHTGGLSSGWLSFNVIFSLSTALLLLSAIYALLRLQGLRDNLEQTVKQRTQAIRNTLEHAELALKAARQRWFQYDLRSGAISAGGAGEPSDSESHIRHLLPGGICPEQQEQFTRALRLHFQHSDADELEYKATYPDGSCCWLQVVAKPLTDNTETDRLIGVISDISHKKQTLLQERAKLQVLEKLIKDRPLEEVLTAIVEMIESNGTGAMCSILLVDPDKKTLRLGAAPGLPESYNAAIDGISYGEGVGSCGTAAARGERVIVDNINTHPYWAPYKTLALSAGLQACWSEPIKNSQNEVLGTFAVYHRQPQSPSAKDISGIEFATHLALLAIEKTTVSERMGLLFRFFNEADEGIMVTDLNARIIDVNPKFTEITGYSADDVRFRTPAILNSGKQDRQFYDAMWKQITAEGHWKGEIWNRRKDGQLYAEKLAVSSITNEEGEVTNYVGIFSDITHFKDQQQALHQMAYHDALTGLPNRVRLTEVFHKAAERCRYTGAHLAVCFLDLDNFKQINDNFGHSAGDELLRQVSQRVLSCLRTGDTLARLGGDEFAILIDNLQPASNCHEVLTRIHETLAEPFVIASTEVTITASSGVTLFPDDDEDLDTLLRHADQAMYKVKVQGKNSFQLFNVEQDHQLVDSNRRRSEVEKALHRGELELHYQPKVSMPTGDVWGAEALIRWRHPEQGLIPPASFLPDISDSSVEIQVGNWVIDQALQQLVQWQRENINLEVSVNVSAFHLLSPTFCSDLDNALNRYPNLQRRYFQIEILESADFKDLQAIENVIGYCRNSLGIGFSLDDFGTGFSSLAHLRHLSIDNIKIDCSFVRDLMSNPNDFRIVEGVIKLADAFNRSVIAEGVESSWEGRMLMMMGCTNAQGYGISRPIPANEVPLWINQYRQLPRWKNTTERNIVSPQHPFDMADLFVLVLDFNLHSVRALLSGEQLETPVPDRNYRHSLFISWLQRCRKESPEDTLWLNTLEGELKALYLLYASILDALENNEITEARGQLADFEHATAQLQRKIRAKEAHTEVAVLI